MIVPTAKLVRLPVPLFVTAIEFWVAGLPAPAVALNVAVVALSAIVGASAAAVVKLPMAERGLPVKKSLVAMTVQKYWVPGLNVVGRVPPVGAGSGRVMLVPMIVSDTVQAPHVGTATLVGRAAELVAMFSQ